MVTTTHHLILAGGSVRHKSPSNPSQPRTSTYHGCHSSRTWERLCRLSSVAHLLSGENVEQLRSSPKPGARFNGDAVPVAEELRGRNSCDSKSHCFPTPSLLLRISSLDYDDDTLCCWGFGGRSACWCSLMCDQLLCDSLHPAAKGWLQFLCELEEQCCLVGTCGVKHVEEGVLEMVNWKNFYD